MGLSGRIRDAWLLPLCLPPGKEGICHPRRHSRIQLGGPWGLWVLLGSHCSRTDPIPKHALTLLPPEPITNACHLALQACQGLVWLAHSC